MLGVWLEVLEVTTSSLVPPCKTSRACGAMEGLLSDMDQLVTLLVFEPAE